MGRKDHLSTIDEANKRQRRDFKKVASVLFQGNPPIFTEGLDQVGLKARTTGEVRDTDFPILFDIDDQAQGENLDEYRLDLSKQDAMYHRIIIGDEDEAAQPILNIDVFFDNLPKNKELQFTIEFVKDPAIVTDPTLTFSPPLDGVPVGFPDDFPIWYFLISARTLPDNTTRFQLLNFGTGGSATTFPILYPEENLGTIGFVTQIITVSGSDGQFKEITMNGDIDLAFAGFPATTVLEEWWILFIQDGAGGHSLTSTQGLLKNAGFLNSLIDKTANARTLFHFATGDGGTSIHGDLVDLTAGGGGFSGNLSDLVIDVNKDWNGKSINNLAGIDLFANAVANGIFNSSVITFISNAASSRGQFGRSDEFGTADGLTANIMAGDNFIVAVDTNEKFRIDSTLQEVRTDYPINMKGNRIIIDSSGTSSIGSPAFFVDDQIDFVTASTIGMSLTAVGFAIFKNTTIFGNVDIDTGFLIMNSGQIFAGGAGVGMANIGNLTFVSNLATPAADVSIFSDGTFLKARSNLLVGNVMLNPQIEDLNMGIFDILSTNAPTVGNRFRIIFDGHEDSDTFISNTSVADDRILVVVAGLNVLTFATAGINAFDPIDMNTNDIQAVGNMDFGASAATSGRIRLPAGGGGAIKWPTVPASGFHGEMYFDNDFNWFVDSGGEYKYFIGGLERFRIDSDIEFFENADMNNNDIVRIQNLAFNDLGGQIAVDLNVFQFVTTSPLGIFRFTPQGNNTLDITEDGLIMSENIELSNNDITGVNRLEFNIAGQVIFDGPSALTIQVGINDTIDFIVNSVPTFQVSQGFCDFFTSFWDMTAVPSPFNPPVNQRRVFVNSVTGELSVRTATGSIISLEQGGAGVGYNTIQDEGNPLPQQTIINFVGAGVVVTDGAGVTTVTIAGGGAGSDRIVALTGDAVAIVQASTFQVFTSSVERFNINPSGTISLLSSGEINMIGNVNMNDNKIFDVNTIEFESPENITLDNTKALITSELDGTGTAMIFNVPNGGSNNDFYEFYTGTFPNNPVLTFGRNRFQYITAGTLSGSTVRFISEQITLQVAGNPLNAKINFVGGIGTNIIPNQGDSPPSLTLGQSTPAFINDAKFWNLLAVKNIHFQSFGTTNIHFAGNDLFIECGPALNRDIIFGRSNGQEFFRCTDDGDVFTPENQVIFTAESVFNGQLTINGVTSINEDLNFDANKTIDWDVATFSPTANAGGATLPSNPLGFLFIKIDGANAKIPFYGV